MMISPDELKSLYKQDLSAFCQLSFKQLNPGQAYKHNWHIDLLAQYLEGCYRGDIKRLLITLPPRTLKSHCVSVAFPAWILGKDPTKKIICINGSYELSAELELNCQKLMNSIRYRSLFDSAKVEIESSALRTEHGGQRYSTTVTKALMGKGADIVIIDDPISLKMHLMKIKECS